MQSIKFEDGVWAVIHTAHRKYIGRLSGWIKFTTETLNELSEGRMQELSDAFELHTGMSPIMTPQGPAMQHVVQVLPIDGAQGPSKIHVKPTAIHLFTDMQPSDVERHKNLVERFMEQLQKAVAESRAEKAGIKLASQMPGGGGGRPRLS